MSDQPEANAGNTIFAPPIVPAPYSMLSPMSKLKADDKEWNEEGGRWRKVTQLLWGKHISDAPMNWYCRLVYPAGFEEITKDDEQLTSDCLVWIANGQDEWRSLGSMEIHKLTLKQFVEKMEPTGVSFHICKPVHKPEIDSRDLSPPTYHRELFIGETVRTGDRWIHPERPEWVQVTGKIIGHEISNNEVNHGVRYARPVSGDWQVWWVNMKSEDPKCGTGSQESPYGSLDHAEAVVQAAYREHNRVPHGIFMDVAGVPLLAYDQPEPDDRAVRHKTLDQQLGKKPAPAEKPTVTADYVYNIAAIANAIGTDVMSMVAQATKDMPAGYRSFQPGEEATQADLVYRGDPVNRCGNWVGVNEEELYGATLLASMMFARLIAAPDKGLDKATVTTLKSLHNQLTTLLQRIGEIP